MIKHLVLCLCLCPALLAGCSSFNSDWDALAAKPVAPSSILDRWEGKWISEVSDHEGSLRCIVEKTLPADLSNKPAPTGTSADYLFRFSATWGPGIVSNYDIAMKVTMYADGTQNFQGEMDLGLFMGTYQCQGTIVGDKFHAKYTSDQDHGTFEMTRPKP